MILWLVKGDIKPPVKAVISEPILEYWSSLMNTFSEVALNSREPQLTPPNLLCVAVHISALWIIDISLPAVPSSPICPQQNEYVYRQTPKDH